MKKKGMVTDRLGTNELKRTEAWRGGTRRGMAGRGKARHGMASFFRSKLT